MCVPVRQGRGEGILRGWRKREIERGRGREREERERERRERSKDKGRERERERWGKEDNGERESEIEK